MRPDEIVKNFVETYNKAQRHLDESQVDSARKQYYLLLDIYSKLMKTEIDEFQRELAYDQITKVFNRIKENQVRDKVPVNIIVAGVLIVILSIIVALNPAIVGLAAFQDEISQPVNLVFTNTTVSTGILKQTPLSFAITGKFEGESAKLFLEHQDKLILVFDSEQASIDEDGNFEKICIDSCKLENYEGTTVQLFVEVLNGRLEISDLVYHIERIENQPPQWVSETNNFKITGRTEINLSRYFKDPENDKLVFLSTTEDGIDVRVERDKLIITPASEGGEQKTITLIASDLQKLTKVPVILDFS